MKKFLFSIVPVLFFTQILCAQVVTIPDAIFKSYLVGNAAINTNNDAEIQVSEAVAFKGKINVGAKSIKSLIGIEAFVNITELDCTFNQLTNLDVSKNTVLMGLFCDHNKLSALDISKNTSLIHLTFTSNKLTSLDVSQNTILTLLYCHSNQLTSLDISKNTVLTDLNCISNLLTSLDVSKNTALEIFHCYSNQLTSLDISKNTTLKYLTCSNNQLTSLDVSKNTTLTALDCSSNQLTSLNLKNGKNSLLSTFDATKNSSLTCIQVDDATKIGSSWKKDDTATYSTKCSVSEEDVLFSNSMKLYPNPVTNNLFISWEGDTQKVNLELFNSQGVLVKRQSIDNQGSVNIEDLPKGLYICKVKDTNKAIYTSKVVIE